MRFRINLVHKAGKLSTRWRRTTSICSDMIWARGDWCRCKHVSSSSSSVNFPCSLLLIVRMVRQQMRHIAPSTTYDEYQHHQENSTTGATIDTLKFMRMRKDNVNFLSPVLLLLGWFRAASHLNFFTVGFRIKGWGLFCFELTRKSGISEVLYTWISDLQIQNRRLRSAVFQPWIWCRALSNEPRRATDLLVTK